ncbi:MAG: hypothetical protein ACREMY_13470, partial [bacterium]
SIPREGNVGTLEAADVIGDWSLVGSGAGLGSAALGIAMLLAAGAVASAGATVVVAAGVVIVAAVAGAVVLVAGAAVVFTAAVARHGDKLISISKLKPARFMSPSPHGIAT